MTQRRMFRQITFPNLTGYAIASIGLNWRVLLKTRALISAIGLHHLVFFEVSTGRSARNPFTFLIAIMAI